MLVIDVIEKYRERTVLETGQRWRHPAGEIILIRRYGNYGNEMVTINQLHISTGTKWIKSDLSERDLKNYFWLVRAKLVVSSNEIWKELCLK